MSKSTSKAGRTGSRPGVGKVAGGGGEADRRRDGRVDGGKAGPAQLPADIGARHFL